MGRPWDKHLDNRELNALVPSSCETGYGMSELSSSAVREARRHVDSCVECSGKVAKYRQLVDGFIKATIQDPVRGNLCPNLNDDDWREVAAGQWPDAKAQQLIAHAALCDHCGTLLRSGVRMDDRRQEIPSGVGSVPRRVPKVRLRWEFPRWLVPFAALALIVGVLGSMRWSSHSHLSGTKFAEFAVNAHRQHAQGQIALDLHSSSQQELNNWLKAKSPFPMALPASPIGPGEERPYDLQGAQLVRIGGKTAAFIAYQLKAPKVKPASASLMVTTDSVATAAGGIEVHFKKVSFHYSTVEGYKVVTWSVHGLTYALVSDEGNGTQGSCMVCHSALRDRDLSRTPAPLGLQGNVRQPIWQ